MNERVPRIGYVPYSATLEMPGDRRRFAAYAKARNLPFELARPEERYDLVVLSELADISVWCDYPHGKVVYDLIDSYLAIPRSNVKQWLRGPAWFIMGRHRRLRIDYWAAIQNMCRRADAVVCTTEEQKCNIQRYCQNTHIILDVHTAVVRSIKQDYRCGEPFNLVWEGLPSNISQLEQIHEVLGAINRHRPLVLNLVTDPDQRRLLGRFGRAQSIDLAHKVFDSVLLHTWDEVKCSEIIRGCDLAVIPIDLSDPFVSGKPENKLLLLWRMGMPVVTSATPAYQRAMLGAGTEGFACRDQEEWMTAIECMISDESLRREVGTCGRAFAEMHYSEEALLACWDRMFASLGFSFHSSAKVTNTRTNNSDPKTVEGFGDEWTRFDQSSMLEKDARHVFESYFSIFPWSALSKDAVGFDLGCSSGRWAKLVAPHVGMLHCIDPSVAIEVARRNLCQFANCEFHRAGVDDLPISDQSMDFGYSLGVLHHVPDTRAALTACVTKLKPGAPFLLYLYYAFDNRPVWFRVLWQVSDRLRKVISNMPHGPRYTISQIIALLVYWPLARAAKLAETLGINVTNFPLSSYRNCGFYVMRTDALDRFGTRLEQRFTKLEIKTMMEHAGLENIRFSEATPFWCAVGSAKNTGCAA